MPSVLTLNPPAFGMTSVVNVDGRVGPAETNNSADVRVVQRLMIMASRSAASRIAVPSATGNYDATTGFWIYHLQATQRPAHPGQVVDGIVSPARGGAYAPHTFWTIVMLNALAKQNNPAEYATFLSSGGS